MTKEPQTLWPAKQACVRKWAPKEITKPDSLGSEQAAGGKQSRADRVPASVSLVACSVCETTALCYGRNTCLPSFSTASNYDQLRRFPGYFPVRIYTKQVLLAPELSLKRLLKWKSALFGWNLKTIMASNSHFAKRGHRKERVENLFGNCKRLAAVRHKNGDGERTSKTERWKGPVGSWTISFEQG